MAGEANPSRRRKSSFPTVPDLPQFSPPKPEAENNARGFKLPVNSQPLVPIHTPVPYEPIRRRRRVDSKPLVPIHTPVPIDQPFGPIHTPSILQLPPLTPPTPATPRKSWARRFRTGLELFVVIAFVVFMLRLFVGEAFLVPSGSMAMPLLGNHKSCQCPCCGHEVQVGRWGSGLIENEASEMSEIQRRYSHACCPNCGWQHLGLERVPESSGDRLLVHKNIFNLRAPQRWEMAVFRHPELQPDAPEMAYVKRIVGLPGETVQLREGELYINDRLARKSLSDLRQMRQLVYDDDHRPQDAPKPFRWQGEHAKEERTKKTFLLQPPEKETDYVWLAYHHLVRGKPGRSEDNWIEEDVTDQQGYNGERVGRQQVWDLMLTGEIEPQGASWFALAFTDGHDDFLLEIPIGGQPRHARLTVRPAGRSTSGKVLSDEANKTVVLSRRTCEVPTQGATTFEVGCVDRTIFLTLDGKSIFQGHVLPEALPSRERLSARGSLSLSGRGPMSVGSRGGALRVRHLQLYRDICYLDNQGGPPLPHGVQTPVKLGPGEFFVLGDNSATSYDSRCWPRSPVVRAEWIIGKPCLVHFPVKWTPLNLGGSPQLWALPDWSRVRILR